MSTKALHPKSSESLVAGLLAQLPAGTDALPLATTAPGKIARTLLRRLAADHGIVGTSLSDVQLLALWKTGAIDGIPAPAVEDAPRDIPRAFETPAPAPAPAPGNAESDLLAALRKAVGTPALDETRVRAMIEEHAPKAVPVSDEKLRAMIEEACAPPTVRIVLEGNGAKRDMGERSMHPRFELVLKTLTNHQRTGGEALNVYCWGPAGSGKTTLAKQVAEALDVPLLFTGKVEHIHTLLGFVNVSGYQRTPFRDAWENGGVFLLDELDRSNPSAIVALNAALAGDTADFPDGIVARHASFFCISTGNTALRGATKEYRSAQAQDAAAIDRWVLISVGYDEKLELAVSMERAWTKRVQKIRKAVESMPHLTGVLVTPRASIKGGQLLADGWSMPDVEESCLFSGLDAATVAKIKEAAKLTD